MPGDKSLVKTAQQEEKRKPGASYVRRRLRYVSKERAEVRRPFPERVSTGSGDYARSDGCASNQEKDLLGRIERFC